MNIESIRDGGTVQIDDLYIDYRINSPTPYAVYSPKYPNSPNVQPICTEDELWSASVILFAALKEADLCTPPQLKIITQGYVWVKEKLEGLI